MKMTNVVDGTSPVKRKAVDDTYPHPSKRAPDTNPGALDAFMATITQAIEQYRDSDEPQKQDLKDNICELKGELDVQDDMSKDDITKFEETVLRKDDIIACDSRFSQSAVRGLEEVRAIEKVRHEELLKEREDVARVEITNLLERIAELQSENFEQESRIGLLEDEKVAMRREDSALVKDVYDQRERRNEIEIAKMGLELRLRCSTDQLKQQEMLLKDFKTLKERFQMLNEAHKAIVMEKSEMERRHFAVRVQEEHFKQEEIKRLKIEHQDVIVGKNARIKGLESKQSHQGITIEAYRTVQQQKADLEKRVEDLERLKEGPETEIASMHLYYRDLYQKNCTLHRKLLSVSKAASFGRLSKKTRKTLDDLKGVPLEELKGWEQGN